LLHIPYMFNKHRCSYHLLLKTLLDFTLAFYIFHGPLFSNTVPGEGLPLYYYQDPRFVNFGDYLSLKIVERILDGPVTISKKRAPPGQRKFLALGSLLFAANDHDIVWGSGTNNKRSEKSDYNFTTLDVRAVRGPLTREFLMEKYGIPCPEIYGDPALLLPYLFPEFKKSENPDYDYVVIVHYNDLSFFPKDAEGRIVYATEQWNVVIKKILNCQFVISSSLHGIIVAEAFGIPARLLRINEKEPLIKYADYYLGTKRLVFQFASSVEEALQMGGEPPFQCDLEKLYDAFPFEFWPSTDFIKPQFK
jgi:pyruvyltransferase